MQNNFPKCMNMALAVILSAAVGHAQAKVAELEISDGAAAYPYSTKVLESKANITDHSLALGAMKKTRGIWGPEVEKRVDGELYRLTQQVDAGHSAREVFQYYRNRLLNSDARELFVCFERACGSSNSWANDYFHIKELYGLDGDQFYSLFEILDDQDHLHYISFYTVARGNNRVFAHVEWLKTQLIGASAAAPNREVIVQQLNDRGYYIVSGMAVENGEIKINQEHLQALITALNRSRSIKVDIVGHDYQEGALAEQQQRSLSYAEYLLQQLQAAGIHANRMQAHGVGSLAPAKSGAEQTMRVEIVLTEQR